MSTAPTISNPDVSVESDRDSRSMSSNERPLGSDSVAERNVEINRQTIAWSDASLFKRVLYHWWIVPRVQWDMGALDYQLYTFEIFHQDWKSKLAHYVTIPMIAFSLMVFLAQFQWGGDGFVNGALVYAGILTVLHYPWCRKNQVTTLWAVCSGTVLGMWLLATVVYRGTAVPDAPWWHPTIAIASPLIWVYVWSFIETASHALEPVPPYASGSDRFVPMAEFQKRGGVYLLLNGLYLPTFYTIVSFVSNLHLLPTFLLRMMASAGFRVDYVQRFTDLASEQWQTGQPVIHVVPEKLP